MSAHTVTLDLPAQLYDHFKRRAEETHRPMEAELLDVVARSVPDEDLPPDLVAMLSELESLDDEALWEAARSQLPLKARNELENLNYKQQNEGLSQGERDLLWQRVEEYERNMLVRAQAMSLLKERGFDVSEFLADK